jgi:hypothetical protein
MAKPLTQKKLKAMQKKAQERLDAQRKQLASLEQTYAGLKGKPSPFTDKATSPSKLAAAEGGAIGAAQIASRMPVQVPEGSMAANVAAQATSALQLQAEALANPLIDDPYYKRNSITGLSPAQVEAKKAVIEAARISKRPIISTGFGNTPIVGGSDITTKTDTADATDAITTNVEVLKAMLRSMGFNGSIIDSSTSFLMALLKDGLDYDNAVAIFLNAKDYTFKKGNKMDSPFYAEYGIYNEGLIRAKTPAELYNAVEGYKEIADKYKLNNKFITKDYMKQYIKNNVTVAQLDERANSARLRAVNSDPFYIKALMELKFINAASDLTDFFLDPKIGQEGLEQNRATAAFSTEAIRRAGEGIKFDATRATQTTAGLIGLGLNEAQIGATAAQGFENIAANLKPLESLSNVYGSQIEKSKFNSAQEELEQEEFLGLASKRRKQTTELEKRSFQASPGTSQYSLKKKTAGII